MLFLICMVLPPIDPTPLHGLCIMPIFCFWIQQKLRYSSSILIMALVITLAGDTLTYNFTHDNDGTLYEPS